MCGILGFFPSPFSEKEAVEKLSLLAHRGPDEAGWSFFKNHFIGARRLSIQDVARGHQPVWNEEKDIIAVLNGEIYNAPKWRTWLLARGHRLLSSSDTEILPHLYEEKGEEFVHSLEGMFAFLLYDQKKEKLLAGRDPLGIKPLYYRIEKEALYLSSEIQPLLFPPPLSFNDKAFVLFLLFGFIPAPFTIFKKIYKLLPGTLLIKEKGAISQQRYFSLPEPETLSVTQEKAREQFEALFLSSLQEHLLSDVEVATFLSGGIDSSLINWGLVKLGKRKRAFTVSFKGDRGDELKWARACARRLNVEHEIIYFDPPSLEDTLKLLPFFGEPFADASFLPTFQICKAAAARVKVVLSGDGGDELACGYDWLHHFLAILPLRFLSFLFPEPLAHPFGLAQTVWDKAHRFAFDLSTYPFYAFLRRRLIFPPPVLLRLLPLDFKPLVEDCWLELVEPYLSLPPVRAARKFDLEIFLPDDILVKVDRMAGAVGLEVRPPLLSCKLVSYLQALPLELKWEKGKSKVLFKSLLSESLGAKMIQQRKQGFMPDLASFLRRRASFFLPLFPSPYLVARGLNSQFIKEMFLAHQQGRADFSHQLFALYVLHLFFLWQDQKSA